MRFLLDANLPRSATEVIRQLGYEGFDVREIGLGGAEDTQIAAHAVAHGLVLVTRDFDFSDVRNYPPAQFAGIIVLQLPDDAVASVVVRVLKTFLSQPAFLGAITGRLAIVESWRVRFRPPFVSAPS